MMKKPSAITLIIPNPCSENWAEMTVVDKGRFCSHCQKTVTDLTGMTDAAIVQLFQQQAETHCIRAFSAQLNRQITLPPQAPTRFYRIAVALGLTIIMAGTEDAYARPKAPLVEQNYLLDTGDSTAKIKSDSNTFEIYGKVVDEEGNPFPGVVVKVFASGLLKTGNVTEDDGSFSIKNIVPNDYEVEFNVFSYHTQRISLKEKNLAQNKPIHIIMVETGITYDLEIVGALVSPSKKHNDHGKTIYHEDDLKSLGF